jgi:hypothetical protein
MLIARCAAQPFCWGCCQSHARSSQTMSPNSQRARSTTRAPRSRQPARPRPTSCSGRCLWPRMPTSTPRLGPWLAGPGAPPQVTMARVAALGERPAARRDRACAASGPFNGQDVNQYPDRFAGFYCMISNGFSIDDECHRFLDGINACAHLRNAVQPGAIHRT